MKTNEIKLFICSKFLHPSASADGAVHLHLPGHLEVRQVSATERSVLMNLFLLYFTILYFKPNMKGIHQDGYSDTQVKKIDLKIDCAINQ